MEEDIPGFKVQNHGFGGSADKDLVYYAGKVAACMEYKKEIVKS
jgi:hypothetical protein